MIFSAKKPDGVALESPSSLNLRDVPPEFAAISDKLQQLCQREDELIAEMRPLRHTLAAAGAFNSFDAGMVSVPKEEPLPIAASDAASALLGDLTPAPRLPPAPFIPQKVRHPDSDKFAALARELNAVQEALSLLRDVPNGELHSVLSKAHLEASKAFCREIETEYATIAKDYIDALLALGRATVAHNRFVEERLCGVRWGSLRPIRLANHLGNPLDPTSELRRILIWAAENGRFDLLQIPEDWKSGGHGAKRQHEVLNEAMA